MNIEEIKLIVNAPLLSEEEKRSLIISSIAADEKAIPDILEILAFERKENNKLLVDTNAELSRAFIVLKDENVRANKKVIVDPKWVVEQIKDHYLKWQHRIKCCYPVDGLT